MASSLSATTFIGPSGLQYSSWPIRNHHIPVVHKDITKMARSESLSTTSYRGCRVAGSHSGVSFVPCSQLAEKIASSASLAETASCEDNLGLRTFPSALPGCGKVKSSIISFISKPQVHPKYRVYGPEQERDVFRCKFSRKEDQGKRLSVARWMHYLQVSTPAPLPLVKFTRRRRDGTTWGLHDPPIFK